MAIGRDLDRVKALLAAGVNVNMTDSMGKTPLMEAAQLGALEEARLLIQANANINAQSKTGWTSLMWAAKHHHPALVKLLLDAGADVHLQNCGGQIAKESPDFTGARAKKIRILLGAENPFL